MADYTADQIIQLTNEYRKSQGLPPLKSNPALTAAAVAAANDMAENGYFAHQSPSGKTYQDFANDSGYKYVHVGQNLARNWNSATDTVDAWSKSPTHNANLVDKLYTETGVAVVPINGSNYVIQYMGYPGDAGSTAVTKTSSRKASAATSTPAVTATPQLTVPKPAPTSMSLQQPKKPALMDLKTALSTPMTI